MYLTHIDTLDLTAAGSRALLTNKSRPIEYSTQRRQRSDASAFVGASVNPGAWEVAVTLPDDAARDALIVSLDGNQSREFRLQATRYGVDIEAYAALRRLDLPSQGRSAQLTFEPTYPTWRSLAPTTTSDTVTTDDTVTVTVPGNTRVAPVIRIQPTAQRSSQTAAVGWKRRSRYRVTNNGDETMYRYPVRISLGSTTAIVSGGRALASGNDVRVWSQGREVARTLVGWNSAASYVWIIVPVLRPGRSLDFDVHWHNAAAGAPPTLTYPELPAFDLAISTNALWRYQVTAGNGAYYLSSGVAPPVIDQEVPGAWHAALTLPNPDNADDTAQYPYHSFESSGTKYSGPFKAARGIAGGLSLPNEGLADGISLHHPLGITSVNVPISYQNDLPKGNASTPMGKFVILTRATGSQGWDILFERTTAQNGSATTIARTTYTPASTVKNLAFAVWPRDEIEMVETVEFGKKIEARWSDYCDVAIDSSDLSITTVQSETEVYEVATVLSVDPGDGQTTSYDLRLGAAGSTGDQDAPRLAVELNQVVVLDGTTRRAEVWNASLTSKVADVPNFAVRAIRTAPVLGVETETPTQHWVPLKPDPSGVALVVAEVELGTLAVGVDVFAEWVP